VTLPGNNPSSEHHVVIGRVVAVHIDDAILTAEGRIDVLRIRPVARLGYTDYTYVDSTFEMEKRPPRIIWFRDKRQSSRCECALPS